MKNKIWVPIVCFFAAVAVTFGIVMLVMPDDEPVTKKQNPVQNQETLVTTPTPVPEEEIMPVTGTVSGEKALSLVREKQDYSKAKKVTVMVYMNGSNLESDYSEASTDISEMLEAPFNENVNIVLQTMGTKQWDPKHRISSDHAQRFLLKEHSLELVDDRLAQLDCTASSTLTDFIMWSRLNYPADRYILIFWNHGGGPVYGFGYDEWRDSDAALTMDEIQLALNKAKVKFDFIGMDCCVMSCLELCCACYEYTDYMILSEDFESGLGWSYKGFMTALAKNPAIDTVELAKIAIDDMVADNENNMDEGSDSILSLIDESYMQLVYTEWMKFAYANEDELLGVNYSRRVQKEDDGRMRPGLEKYDAYSFSEYYLTDIMALAQNIESEEKDALSSAISNAVVYSSSCGGDNVLTGLSVTLPYGDVLFYDSLETIFLNCGLDKDYVSWLANFTEVSNSGYGLDDSAFYDYSDWDEYWDGWDSFDDEYDWEDWYYDDEYDYGWNEWDPYEYYDDYDDKEYGYDANFFTNYIDYLYDYYGEDFDFDEYYDDYYGNYSDYDDEYYDGFFSNYYDNYDYNGYSGSGNINNSDDYYYDDYGYYDDYDDYDNYDYYDDYDDEDYDDGYDWWDEYDFDSEDFDWDTFFDSYLGD